jgi:hypothetical protein
MKSSQAIYLCYSYNTNINSNCFFICKRFASVELAASQQECLNNPNLKYPFNQNKQPNPSSAIIPVCKYIPRILHIYVLRYKLSKHFFGIKIY